MTDIYQLIAIIGISNKYLVSKCILIILKVEKYHKILCSFDAVAKGAKTKEIE